MKLFLIGCTLAFFIPFSVNANLLVSPTRAELDDTTHKSAIFSLVNKGTSTARYNIYFEDKIQLAEGGYRIIEGGKPALSQFVRYSPRRVTLESEQGTRVRMAARVPKGLPAAEYRSYIVFHQIPLAPRVLNQANDEHAETFSLSVTAFVRISVPVILRIGELEGDVTIDTVTDAEQQTSLGVTIKRHGLRSTYGDIEVFVEKNIGGVTKLENIASVKNVAIYTELDSRNFSVNLTRQLIKGTEVIVRYSESKNLNDAQIIETRMTL